ncbi:hypothetical protein FOZ63_025780 [Perkinsus olseni]|uniref:Uncharacterized protein n=1 Tax=Perkinsus olseni TaxID=32597 RepID=A0A7J6SJ83_PEROL|nr:hypothetical protein FOZ62_023338 [Perkinsus olseni]KAF4737517.1 hypothetical protein FOZ63_025780 [Perkinsus olseni]
MATFFALSITVTLLLAIGAGGAQRQRLGKDHTTQRHHHHGSSAFLGPARHRLDTRERKASPSSSSTTPAQTEAHTMLRRRRPSITRSPVERNASSSMVGRPGLAALDVLPKHRGVVPVGFAPPTKWRMRPTSTKLTILYFLYTLTITFILSLIMWLAYVKIPYRVDAEKIDRKGYRSIRRTLSVPPDLIFCDQVKLSRGDPRTVSVVTCRCHPRRDISVL